MERKLRILNLEDSANDSELAHDALEQDGVPCDFIRVETRAEFIQALEEGGYDLIISDYALPSFDGIAALCLARAKCPEIPFLFLTGALGEEKAIEILKCGAVDYVLKDRLGKLAHSVKLALEAALDHAEREKAEKALAENEKRFRRLVESVTDYIYTVQVESGRPVATTHGPGCIAVTGYRPDEYDADPGLWYRMINEDDRRAVTEQTASILSGRGAPALEHRICRKDGAIRWIRNTPVPRYDEQGRLLSYDGLISDITDRKRIEEQLRHAQKMEAVGQLAGGVAHDFNNILSAILGYAHILHMKMKDDDPLRLNVEHLLESVDRAAHVTHSLLAFSRKQIFHLVEVDLNESIRKIQKFLRRIISENIELRTAFKQETLPVSADSSQIEQVLMNLATNARDAMPQGGSLTIETDVFELGEAYIRSHGYGQAGTYAAIRVTDSGTGMDEATQKRVFEPFFTTKETGRGTGLGLSIVYGIVKQHHGYINVYSEPGMGTTFTIYIPLLKPGAGPREKDQAAPEQELPGGTETILLAEDDDAVRKLTRDLLEEFGYKVVEAANGEDATKAFFEHQEEIRLLCLDVIMPKKSGREVYDEIRARRPGVKALFVSGYTADKIFGDGLVPGESELLLKPLSPRDLLVKVRQMLDKK